ncbi:MAG: hypothetical protein JWP71_2139 [Mucilaginibacter sp.]|nr:hypothetical protein [Mucilaginibacter sp.]
MKNGYVKFRYGAGALKKIPPQPSLPLAEERVIERLSDDRVSTNKATLPPMHGGDYSPRLRYAERGQKNFNASALSSDIVKLFP